jgi:hypothetical protein
MMMCRVVLVLILLSSFGQDFFDDLNPINQF